MNVQYIPDGAKDINDVINVHTYMTQVMKYARGRSSFAKNRQECTMLGRCQVCKVLAPVDAHHIKPIWAFALEYLLNSGAQTHKAFSLAAAWTIRMHNVDQWHSLTNLEPLCSICHEVAQKWTDQEWQGYFEANYPVVFGRRNLDELLRKLNT